MFSVKYIKTFTGKIILKNTKNIHNQSYILLQQKYNDLTNKNKILKNNITNLNNIIQHKNKLILNLQYDNNKLFSENKNLNSELLEKNRYINLHFYNKFLK